MNRFSLYKELNRETGNVLVQPLLTAFHNEVNFGLLLTISSFCIFFPWKVLTINTMWANVRLKKFYQGLQSLEFWHQKYKLK